MKIEAAAVELLDLEIRLPPKRRSVLMIARCASLVFLLTAAGFAQEPARLEQVVQSYIAENQFMGTVLVARGDQVVLSKGYGSANLEWNIPNTPSTKFRLGSITKQFTAACILLLEERGKLKIEDPVKKYMADAPAAWDKITIYNLLTHTAGIPNFTSFPDYATTQALPSPAEKTVARFRDKPLDFEPGSKFSYSNSGYVLLGYLIEKVSGQSYEKFVRENIFTPLEMKDSGYDSNSAVIARRASGYTQAEPGMRVNAGIVHMSVPGAAGGLYSTTEDLLKWERGLFGGKVLSAASLQKMTTPFMDDYAFGLLVRTSEGHKQIWHNGGIDGFNTSMAYYPDSKIVVIVLANLNGQAPDLMLPKLGAVAHGDAVVLTTERKQITVSTETLARYVGTYELAPRVNITMTLAGDQLMTQLSGQPRFPVFAETETKFFLKVVDAQLEFLKDGDKVTDVILHQGGRDQKARRISDTVAEPKEIAVSPQILAAYAGTYEIAGLPNLVVTLEDGQLMMALGAQPKLPLFAESETNFFLKAVDAQLEFVKDASGAVTHANLHQGIRDLKAQRR
jgi:CubicO group peptidase (beta-lactamase class C family)